MAVAPTRRRATIPRGSCCFVDVRFKGSSSAPHTSRATGLSTFIGTTGRANRAFGLMKQASSGKSGRCGSSLTVHHMGGITSCTITRNISLDRLINVCGKKRTPMSAGSARTNHTGGEHMSVFRRGWKVDQRLYSSLNGTIFSKQDLFTPRYL